MAKNESATTRSLTAYVADFIASVSYDRLPEDVLALGKKSILDGLGLALAGSVADSGRIVRDVFPASSGDKALGVAPRPAGSPRRRPP